MSMAYKVYRRVKGATSRELIAKFIGCADAYQYAIAKSLDPMRPANSYITVTGWDGKQWWRFDKGAQVSPAPMPALTPTDQPSSLVR